jgi:hypothetical protein
LAHEAFALPRVIPIDWLELSGAEAIPRIRANGIVVQRAAWELKSETLSLDRRSRSRFAEFKELRKRIQRCGLPEWCFVRWSKQEKPMLIDTRSPWGLELLHRIAHKTLRLRITEMYPDPTTMFWDGGGLGTQTFELRMALLRENQSTIHTQEGAS